MKQIITQIVPMSLLHARDISTWKYLDEYSIYSFSETAETIAELMNGTYYACTNKTGRLIGYFCYGKSAQIPTLETNIYTADLLDIGLGLKPELCGQGFGETFLKAGLAYAHKQWNLSSFRLSVVTFNERAQKVYRKLGFSCTREVTHARSRVKFIIMEADYTNELARCKIF